MAPPPDRPDDDAREADLGHRQDEAAAEEKLGDDANLSVPEDDTAPGVDRSQEQ